MKANLITLCVAAALLGLAPSQASAWTCRATGVGASGTGQGFSAERAKFRALRQCERASLMHVCTILWCRR
jgi:hypothetical protein